MRSSPTGTSSRSWPDTCSSSRVRPTCSRSRPGATHRSRTWRKPSTSAICWSRIPSGWWPKCSEPDRRAPRRWSRPFTDGRAGIPTGLSASVRRFNGEAAGLTETAVKDAVEHLLLTEDRNLPHIFRALEADQTLTGLVKMLLGGEPVDVQTGGPGHRTTGADRPRQEPRRPVRHPQPHLPGGSRAPGPAARTGPRTGPPASEPAAAGS